MNDNDRRILALWAFVLLDSVLALCITCMVVAWVSH